MIEVKKILSDKYELTITTKTPNGGVAVFKVQVEPADVKDLRNQIVEELEK